MKHKKQCENQQLSDLLQDDTPRTWTINFDLNTKSPYYHGQQYKQAHNFLAKHGFQYRQHSGDISTCEMPAYKVVETLDALYKQYPKIKACTNSCLFTSVSEKYSFTDIREAQRNTEPEEFKFTMHLEIKENDMKDVFNTVDPNGLESCIRNSFISPPNLKERMIPIIKKKSNGSISIDWTSNKAISSLDKTIATNHIFVDYPKLLEKKRHIIFEMNYNENTTSLIADQQRIVSDEKKHLIEYDMNYSRGKESYDSLNGHLKDRLAYFGLERIQESGWISKNGMTDEQVQAILTEVFQENCDFDKITEIMDITIVNETYDYMKLSAEQNISSSGNSGQNSPTVKKSTNGATKSSKKAPKTNNSEYKHPLPFVDNSAPDDNDEIEF